jgi:hypothetical protein
VTVRLAASCEPRTAGEVVDEFPGGCVAYRPDPDAGSSASLLGQAKGAVILRTRDELAEALRRRSGGRLHLDPEGGS